VLERKTMAMRATKFEFERRFWIIVVIYAAGFWLTAIDHTGAIAGLRQVLLPRIAADTPEARTFSRALILFGSLLVFAAAALRTWAAAYLRSDVVHDTNQHSGLLVADGPFRHTRNPLYLGSVIMAAGIGVLASRSGWLFLVLGNAIFVCRLIAREEQSLRLRQGETYRHYCEAVPRFWPSLKARLPVGNRPARWAQGFAGETFVWMFGIAELSIALTLNPGVGLVVFLLGFVAYFITIRLLPQPSDLH
jgi:protein-S-isoprenylcysteine O-methyltransferase Ste14